MRRILVVIILLIVYGSLYPWHFVARHLPASPIDILWHSRQVRMDRFMARDVVVNIALYIPLGMAGYLAMRRRVIPPVALGFALSVSLELAQLYVPGRDTSAVDVLTNVMGTIAGIAFGGLFHKLAPPRLPAGTHGIKVSEAQTRPALLLLFVWAGYLLFPLFPSLSLHRPLERINAVLHSSPIALIPLISAAAAWLAAGELMEAAGVPDARWYLAGTILVIPVQFFIVGQRPVLGEMTGAVTGIVLFAAFRRMTGGRWIALGFLAVVLVRGFAPFHFTPGAAGFSWIPFAALLETEWQQGISILMEKSFFYGTAVWLFMKAGMRAMGAAIIVAAALAVIEIAQTHLPGRTAEITDPLIALLWAFMLRALARPRVFRHTPAAR